MLTGSDVPSVMKAVQCQDYGPIESMVSVQSGVPIPRLADLPSKQRKHCILIRVLSVSLAPGDVRVLSGKTRELQGPPSFPYVPCGDACGVVVELPPEADEDEGFPFSLGDRVAARFVDGPRGALGQYAIVSTKVTAVVPDDIQSDDAVALVSATPAVLLAERAQKGERVLVIGASGGIGSHLCQLLRHQEVAQIIGVSDEPDILIKPPISCDRAVDYTKGDVFSMPEFQKEPFDLVYDLNGGGFLRFGENSIVKPASQGGRYLTLTPDQPWYEVHSVWQAVHVFLFPSLWRALRSRTWTRRRQPKYSYVMALPMDSNEVATEVFEQAEAGKVKAVIANGGQPFEFSTQGVRDAFKLQESRHAKGKVIVNVAADK